MKELVKAYADSPLSRYLEVIKQRLVDIELEHQHGNRTHWEKIVQEILDFGSNGHVVNTPSVTIVPGTTQPPQGLRKLLMELHPWRKGPFSILGIPIDTEWRSDLKWERIKDCVNWNGASILDVGCGSGYHLWRMWGAGARRVLGIDPTRLYWQQFKLIKGFIPGAPVHFLPFRMVDFPTHSQNFDIVTSMGVLYHCKSPFEHLEQLKGSLKKGGALILETLVVEGPENTVLVPQDRYAQMRNVWCIPSPDTLCHWLKRVGFDYPTIHNISITTPEEQRTTEWMTFHSLKQFLNPDNPSETIEGYPAPQRVVISARRP